MTGQVDDGLLAVAAALLPGESLAAATMKQGQFHDVVLLPGVAAIRIARRPASAASLSRRTELLRRLSRVGLPFAVPVPLSDVVVVDGKTAVAVSWIDGTPQARGEGGDPVHLAGLLDALRQVDCRMLADVLGDPHEYAGGVHWAEVMAEEVIPRLPERWRDEAQRRIDSAHALVPVVPTLVHGDLAGENVHWDSDGRLVGVLDWDLAQPFDASVDAACLAWHGWDKVRAAVDSHTYDRAGVWYLTFGLEQIGAAVLTGETPDVVERYVTRTADWMARTQGWAPPRQ